MVWFELYARSVAPSLKGGMNHFGQVDHVFMLLTIERKSLHGEEAVQCKG